MSRSLEDEIQALEKRLGTDESREAESLTAEDELRKEIAQLEDDLLEDEIIEDDIIEDDDIGDEVLDEEVAMAPMAADADAELEKEAEKIESEDEKVIKDSNEEVTDVNDYGNEDLNTKVSRQLLQLAAAITNPVEDGFIDQDFDEVEKLFNVQDETDSGPDGDVLPVVDKNTDVDESDVGYTARLKEASYRLDRVCNYLEKKGGKWIKVAFRLDKLNNVIDGERERVAKRIASRG